jgi:hypothetical protein
VVSMGTPHKSVLKFRPQDRNRRRWLKWHRESGEYYGLYNWQQNYSDQLWRKMKWPRYYKIGQHLHYLAQHAPKNVRAKWQSAWRRFVKHYQKY